MGGKLKFTTILNEGGEGDTSRPLAKFFIFFYS